MSLAPGLLNKSDRLEYDVTLPVGIRLDLHVVTAGLKIVEVAHIISKQTVVR